MSPRKRDHATTAILAILHEDDREVLTRLLGLHDGAPWTHHDVATELGLAVKDVKEAEARSLGILREHIDADQARELLAA